MNHNVVLILQFLAAILFTIVGIRDSNTVFLLLGFACACNGFAVWKKTTGKNNDEAKK